MDLLTQPMNERLLEQMLAGEWQVWHFSAQLQISRRHYSGLDIACTRPDQMNTEELHCSPYAAVPLMLCFTKPALIMIADDMLCCCRGALQRGWPAASTAAWGLTRISWPPMRLTWPPCHLCRSTRYAAPLSAQPCRVWQLSVLPGQDVVAGSDPACCSPLSKSEMLAHLNALTALQWRPESDARQRCRA